MSVNVQEYKGTDRQRLREGHKSSRKSPSECQRLDADLLIARHTFVANGVHCADWELQ